MFSWFMFYMLITAISLLAGTGFGISIGRSSKWDEKQNKWIYRG